MTQRYNQFEQQLLLTFLPLTQKTVFKSFSVLGIINGVHDLVTNMSSPKKTPLQLRDIFRQKKKKHNFSPGSCVYSFDLANVYHFILTFGYLFDLFDLRLRLFHLDTPHDVCLFVSFFPD